MKLVSLLALALMLPTATWAQSEAIVIGSVFDAAELDPKSGMPKDRPAGLSLDLEACLDGDCIRASEGTERDPQRVVLTPGEQGPVRVRLHLDCPQSASVLGIAQAARVVMVPAGDMTLHCPREPTDAYCEFRFWIEETRWDDRLVAQFFPSEAATAWPDPEHRVDEAEFVIEPGELPPGTYDLVAALPKELVDQYPCESVRNHPWEESLPLRVVIAEPFDPFRMEALVVEVQSAAHAGDLDAMARLIEELKLLTAGSEHAGEVIEGARRACPWIRPLGCATKARVTGSTAERARRACHELLSGLEGQHDCGAVVIEPTPEPELLD